MAASDLDELASPGELTSLLGEIEGIARDAANPAPEPAAFAIGSAPVSYAFGLTSSIESKAAAIVASIQQTLASLAPVATFETSRDGFTARTVLNYSGRAISVWSTGPNGTPAEDFVGAHLATLQRAYAFRSAVVQVIAAVGNALAAISLAVANPLTVRHAVRSAEALKAAVDRLAKAVAINAAMATI
jgi:hypothetical protein